MRRTLMVIAACLGIPSVALAICPENAPSDDLVTFADTDQRVNADWLEKNLSGRVIIFEPGIEKFLADGSYAFETPTGTFRAAGYIFYDNGFRCLDHLPPRLAMYVMSAGQIVLINLTGQRYVGRIAQELER